MGRTVFKQKTHKETHWIGEWAPWVPKLNGASENLANVHFIDSIGSGHIACAGSSRWLCRRKGLWALPLPPPASMANLWVSPFICCFSSLSHGWAHASAEGTKPSCPHVQAGTPVCSPGTAALAGATIGCHQQRCETEHPAPSCPLTAICLSHNRRPEWKLPVCLLFFPPWHTQTVCPPRPKQGP